MTPAGRIPPIQALLAFEAVARLRSVTQAATELNVTPSAVSHRMRQLEAQLGLRLFVSRGDYLPSPEGAAYLARVREALTALQLADRGYVMESGEVTMQGDAKQLLDDPKVRAAYLGE